MTVTYDWQVPDFLADIASILVITINKNETPVNLHYYTVIVLLLYNTVFFVVCGLIYDLAVS